MSFSEELIKWFDQYGRKNLPWQRDISPYRVWVSEIMLQQTQVNTVIPYFERFIANFPNIQALAAASEDAILHHWTGLGYYARARNLHKTAKQILNNHAGEFPTSIEGLMEFPGIGRSTAGAIASIAMGIWAPILDGNVKRVLARHYAVSGWPGQTATSKRLWALAEANTPRHATERSIANYTQAIMDLGATLCTRSKPRCQRCPVVSTCQGYTLGYPEQFPGKRPKKTLPVRSTFFLIYRTPDGEVWLEKRFQQGVWEGLWSFPEIDRARAVESTTLTRFGLEIITQTELPVLHHTFSHFYLDIQPLILDVPMIDKIADNNDVGRWVQPDAPGTLGLPKPTALLLTQLSGRQSK